VVTETTSAIDCEVQLPGYIADIIEQFGISCEDDTELAYTKDTDGAGLLLEDCTIPDLLTLRGYAPTVTAS